MENPPNIWKLNNVSQNKPWDQEDIKHETRKYSVEDENEDNIPRSMGCC